jgi:hypothetical protein
MYSIYLKNNSRLVMMALYVLAALLLCGIATQPRHAHAQSGLPLPTTPRLLVAPAIAPIGTSRTLTVTGQWPNSCAPVAATIDASLNNLAKIIIIRLQAPLAAACATVLTPYTFVLDYGLFGTGVTRVRIVSSTGSVTGEGRVVTAEAGTVRAVGDISGLWYDPSTNGSGVSFAHAYQGGDGVFGTWYLYGSDGLARWFSIQDVTWTNNNTIEGNLYQTRAAADACSAGVDVCPKPITSAAVIGRVKASFIGIGIGSDIVPTTKLEAFSNDGVPLFFSNLIRQF